MFKKTAFLYFSAEDLIEIFANFYTEEYGTKKMREILEKVCYSPKLLKFIDMLRTQRLSPGRDGFITIVNTIPYFLFSKGETLCVGTLIAIQKWIIETKDDGFRLSDEQIHQIVLETIFKAEKTKMHLSGRNFFDIYYSKLDTIIKASFS